MRKSKIILALVTLLTFIIVTVFFNAEIGFAMSVVNGVFSSIIYTAYEENKNIIKDKKFLTVIFTAFALHLLIISSLSIPELNLTTAVVPFAIVDGLLIWCILKLFVKK